MEPEQAATILKRDALGRVTLPRERREALVDEFERSGVPATKFALSCCAAFTASASLSLDFKRWPA